MDEEDQFACCLTTCLLKILYYFGNGFFLYGLYFNVWDLDNYLKEFRYHVNTGCSVINVTDLRPTRGYNCWDIRVLVTSEDNTLFPARLFKSVKSFQNTTQCYGCWGNCTDFGSTLVDFGPFQCFYNPNKPEFAYMETGLDYNWLTYLSIGLVIFTVVNFMTTSLVVCCCKNHRSLKSHDLFKFLFGPCWWYAAPVCFLLFFVFYLPYVLVQVCIKWCRGPEEEETQPYLTGEEFKKKLLESADSLLFSSIGLAYVAIVLFPILFRFLEYLDLDLLTYAFRDGGDVRRTSISVLYFTCVIYVIVYVIGCLLAMVSFRKDRESLKTLARMIIFPIPLTCVVGLVVLIFMGLFAGCSALVKCCLGNRCLGVCQKEPGDSDTGNLVDDDALAQQVVPANPERPLAQTRKKYKSVVRMYISLFMCIWRSEAMRRPRWGKCCTCCEREGAGGQGVQIQALQVARAKLP